MAATTIWAKEALLADGWRHDVRVIVDACGDISAVQPAANAQGAAHRVDVLLPGLANVHSHAHQRAMAGLAERASAGRDSFWTWRDVMYRHLAHIDASTLQAVAAQLYLEMLQAGYTCVGEFQYLHHDPNGVPYANPAELTLRCYAAAEATGIAFTGLPVLYRYADFGGVEATPGQRRFSNSLEQFLALTQCVENALADAPEATWGVAPHSLRAVSPAMLQGLVEALGERAPCPIHLHIAEQTAEVQACERWSGQRPVAWLLDHAPVDARWCAVHATHMTPAESRALAASGACVALCPTTEANLGDGVFDGATFVAAGGAWAIGSDSHVSVDVAAELRLLEYAQRLEHRARNVLVRCADAPSSSGRYLFQQAARTGAQACGRRAGVIAAGYRADLLTLDGEDPSLIGASGDGWLDRWIFAANRPLVKHVWVGGRQVLEDGQHREQSRIAARFRRALCHLINA